jgi:hypothetical protein
MCEWEASKVQVFKNRILICGTGTVSRIGADLFLNYLGF